jgi:hypothetical protein
MLGCPGQGRVDSNRKARGFRVSQDDENAGLCVMGVLNRFETRGAAEEGKPDWLARN